MPHDDSAEHLRREHAERQEQAPSYDTSMEDYAGISSVTETTEDLQAAKDFAEMIVDTVREGLLVLDFDLRVKAANESFYDTFEVAPEETLGRLVYELGSGHWDLPELRKLLEDILPESKVFNDYEVTHDFEGIGERHMLLNARRLNEHQLILLAIEDVSERRRSERELKHSEERLRLLVENATEYAIFTMDTAGMITSWSAGAERILGWTRGEALGQPGSMIFTPEQCAAGVPAREMQLAREQGTAADERWHQRKDHSRFWGSGIMVALWNDELHGFAKILRDETERKEMEEALRESEEQVRRLADTAPAMLWQTQPDGRCTYLSRDWHDYTGQPEGRGLGFGWLEVFHPDDRDRMRAQFLEANERQKPFQLDARLRRRDGTYRWVIDSGEPHLGPDGIFLGYVGSVVDIHDRKEAEEELRRSEERYRTLFTSMDEGFCIVEVLFEEGQPVDYRFLETNPAFAEQTGLEGAEGRRMRELRPRHEEHWFETYGRVAQTGEPERFTSEAKHLGGRIYEGYAFRIGDPEERKVAILFSDVTMQRHAEEALREFNTVLEERVEERTRQVRELAARLTRAEQEERRRVSQILHDELQQLLYGIQMKMTLIQKSAEAGDLGALRRGVSEADEWLSQGVRVTRSLTVDLSPPVLKSEGLTDTLGWLKSQIWQLHGLDVEIKADGGFRTLDDDLRVLLFQIVRELLFNVVKHAGVEEATVELRDVDQHVEIVVSDEGAGFDVEAAEARHQGGFGLFSARERLGLFGGKMEIDSRLGKGTRVVLGVPLRLE